MKIGITGANGLIGWHLQCFLYTKSEYEVVPCDRVTFKSNDRLRQFAEQCDVIVHLAGMNRGDDDEVAATNVRLAKDLINAVGQTDRVRTIIFSSSTQADEGTSYGNSKLEASRLFAQWERASGGRIVNLVLPNVFGECGKPFYNSVVSTFCHLVATGGDPEIHADSELNLLHAQAVAELIYEHINSTQSGDIRPLGYSIGVVELLAEIRQLASSYSNDIVPALRDDFQLRLFNTYRSYLFPEFYPRSLQLREDERGSLFEAVKEMSGGQTFISTTKPGITRGNHYHLSKVERFLVLRGTAEICIRKMFDDKTSVFPVSGERPVFIDMPTCYTHNITNTGDDELVTLFWSNEIFDPANPDTYSAIV